MNKFTIFNCIMIIISFLLFFPLNASGEEFKNSEEPYYFQGLKMVECEKKQLWFTISYDRKPTKALMHNFAVSENGTIAISYNNYAVDIYNKDLEFQYSIKPTFSHCTAAMIWQGEQLFIFSCSNLDINCIIISGYENESAFNIENSKENNSRFFELEAKTRGKYLTTEKKNYYIEDNCLVITDRNTSTIDKIGGSKIHDVLDKMSIVGLIILPIFLWKISKGNTAQLANHSKR